MLSLLQQYDDANARMVKVQEAIGPHLRRRRERLNLGLRQFARRARCDAGSLSLLERGQGWHYRTVRKAFRALDAEEAKQAKAKA